MFEFNGEYLGRVLDVNDTKKEGRIKVKVFSVFDELETESIPWAYPTNNFTGGSFTGGGSFSLPKIGSIVKIHFEKGNIYKPYWGFIYGLTENLKKLLSDENYTKAHSLIFDEETRTFIYKTQEEGMVIKNTENYINLSDNEVVIRQIKFKDYQPELFDNTYVEGEDFPIKSDLPEEVSDRTDNEIVLNENFISLKRYVNGKDSPSKINSILIEDDKITFEVNGNFIELNENSISLGQKQKSEYSAVLFEKLQEFLEKMIDAIGKLKNIQTPSGPTLEIRTAVNWIELNNLKSEIEKFKSNNVTLIK